MQQILLVEDDPFLTEIYSQKLKKSGLKVEVIKDGQKALESLNKKMPDLLLLDIVLPRIEGWEVLRKIRKELKFKNLKIIVLSNLGQKEEVEKGLELGADKYLIKAHYTLSEVVEEIEKILE